MYKVNNISYGQLFPHKRTHKTAHLISELFIYACLYLNLKKYVFFLEETHVCPALNCQGVFVKCDIVERVSYGVRHAWVPVQLTDGGPWASHLALFRFPLL